MKAYWPLDATIFLVVLAILAASLGLGFAVTHVRPPRVARACAWLLVVSSTFGLERLTIAEGAGFRMLTISGALLFSMKAVVSVEHQAGGQRRLRAVAWFGFASLWPGMRPSVFDGVPGPSRKGASALIKKGAGRLIVGVLLVGCAVALARLPDRVCGEEGRRILATVFLLPGLSLTFHFGVFNLLAGLWRFAGAGTNSLFRAPLAAKTLGEFWGRRWNLAFSELTAIGVFRPLSRCVPTGLARVLAFAFSGSCTNSL